MLDFKKHHDTEELGGVEYWVKYYSRLRNEVVLMHLHPLIGSH